jgi:hypothetical protein
MQNRLSAAVGAPTRGYHYDPHRYDGLADRAIAAALFRFVGVLLLRGRLQTLLARREIGGLLCEFAKHHPKPGGAGTSKSDVASLAALSPGEA